MRCVRSMLVGFALLAAVLPSGWVPLARADVGRDQQCKQVGKQLAAPENGPYTTIQIAILTGCHQDAYGEWFWPTRPLDPRLATQVISNEELAATQELNKRIWADYAAFIDTLASYPDMFSVGSDAKPNYYASISYFTDGAISLGLGFNSAFEIGAGMQAGYADYEQRFIAYVNDPMHVDLLRYATWWKQRRIGAMPAFVQDKINPMARPGYIARMGFYRAPWPWEINSSVYLGEYRKWALDSGFIPAPVTPTSTTASANSQDCVTLGYWLGQTSSRLTEAFKYHLQGEFSPVPIPSRASVDRTNAQALSELADKQESSNPPEEARATNALIVKSLREYAAFWSGMADADANGNSAAIDAAFKKYNDGSGDEASLRKEISRLKSNCGLAVSAN